MQFSTKEDVEAPIRSVFDRVSDFEAFERSAMRRGIEIERTEKGGADGLGARWVGKAELRGKSRNFDALVTASDAPHLLKIAGQSDGFDIALEVELVVLTPNRTRMRVTTELKPRNLSARLILQSARLARQKLTKRYKARVHGFAEGITNRT